MKKSRINIKGIELELLPERAIYWPQNRALLVADLHFGKVAHFRKQGIPIPKNIYADDLGKLANVIRNNQVDRILILGDMFHSEFNQEVEIFKKWKSTFRSLHFELVIGNHDIIDHKVYKNLDLELHSELSIDGVYMNHFPVEDAEIIEKHDYCLCGHIHPGYKLRGKGPQVLRLPCFFFGEWQGILPAFSWFTGFKMMKALKNDQVYVTSGKEVFKVAP